MSKPKKLEVHKPKSYRGISLPITRLGGEYWASKDLLDLIWSSIVIILGTPIGTRIMLPEFGSQIVSLLFEPNDDVLRSLAKHYIIDAIGKWENRVTLQEVTTSTTEHTLQVKMRFLIKNLSGVYEGGFTVVRNEGFRLIEQFWGPLENAA